MKKRLPSLLLCLAMLLSACALMLTGCGEKEEEEETLVDVATTLVMWCVTEEGTDDAQARAVAKAMSEITKSEFNAKLVIKYMTEDEYYTNLEAAMKQLEVDALAEKKRLEEERKNNRGDKKEEEPVQTEEKPADDDEIRYDEDGNPIIDTTVYPEVTDYQVDILYLSGYDKYMEYYEKDWLYSKNWITGKTVSVDNYLNQIVNFVPPALLNAAKIGGKTYAIPNNNVIGEYTYMLVDKTLYDRYYYTADIALYDKVHSVVDLADFLEDVTVYEPDVLPINADVNYCMNMIANYWDVDPKTLDVTGNFSVLGYAYEGTDKVNRGDIALRFDNVLNSTTYRNALTQLMDFQFKGYFGTPVEGQTSAVSFVKGDAASAKQYEDDYYVVVVDYPRASEEDLYENMLAVSAFTSDAKKSMQVIEYLNINSEFRNLFQYGIENVNYTLNADGTVSMLRGNAYNMDLAKTGNQFIAYVPEGTDLKVWEFSMKQNQESLIHPLLGFDLASELLDESALAERAEILVKMDADMIDALATIPETTWANMLAAKTDDDLRAVLTEQVLGQEGQTLDELDVERIDIKMLAYLNSLTAEQMKKLVDCTTDAELKTALAALAAEEGLIANGDSYSDIVKDQYIVEVLDPALLTELSELSASVWARIQACTSTEELEALFVTLQDELSIAKTPSIKRGGEYTLTEYKFNYDGDAVDDKGAPLSPAPTEVSCTPIMRMVNDVTGGEVQGVTQEFYLVATYKLTPAQVYYRWMNTYGYVPAGFVS